VSNDRSRLRFLAYVALVVCVAGTVSPAIGGPVVEILSPSASEDHHFGHSIVVSGPNLVVGGADAAYLIDPTTGAVLKTYPNPGGSIAVVGARLVVASQQTVYVFDLATGTQLLTIPVPAPAVDFGSPRVAGLGGDILVGGPADDTAGDSAGAVYLFDGTTGTLLRTFLNPDPDPGQPDNVLDEFGAAIVGVGGNVLVGDPTNDLGGYNEGTAYLFDGATGDLLLTIAIPAPGTPGASRFGEQVGVIGSDLLVASFGAVYRLDSTTGSVLTTYTAPECLPARLAASGNTVLLGCFAPFIVSASPLDVFMFDATSGSLLRSFANPTPRFSVSGQADDGFGRAVALVGPDAVVGAPLDDTVAGDAGALYRFSGGTTGCGPCETPTGPGTCQIARHLTCRTETLPGESPLKIQNVADDARDRVLWRFRGSGTEFVGEDGSAGTSGFGYPLTTTDYAMCVFSGAGSDLAFRAIAPAGGQCAGKACWKSPRPSSPRRYLDSERTPDGLHAVLLKASTQILVRVRGAGSNLSNRPFGLPSLPLALPLTVQLQAEDGACWETTYSAAAINSSTLLKASND
jgi:outer membrane protein assembly factor BamB